MLVRKTLSTGKENFRGAGLAGSEESMLYVIRWGIQAEGVSDGDSPCHEEGTGLEVTKSSPI